MYAYIYMYVYVYIYIYIYIYIHARKEACSQIQTGSHNTMAASLVLCIFILVCVIE